jgi:hypothetical protein
MAQNNATDDAPSLTELADPEGVAVRSTAHGAGEVRSVSVFPENRVVVEFGHAARRVPPEHLDVDAAYYAENPEHATEAVRDVLNLGDEVDA